jgi:predicted N-acetyltransferase YhbS
MPSSWLSEEDSSLFIRRFSPDDAELLSQLIIRNLQLVNIHDYSSEVIEALIPSYSPERIRHTAESTYTIVCIDGETIVGTALLDGNRIRNVFVEVERHGKGIGRRLMAALETHALENQLTRICLHGGVTAEGFYHKLGYRSIKHIVHDLDGVPLSLIRMEKELGNVDR